ncbi:MAG: serine hydrolase domain-containing protein, partial [Geminicoccaceae bacterium]
MSIALGVLLLGPFYLRNDPLVSIVEDFANAHDLLGGVVAYGMPGRDPALAAFGFADHSGGRKVTEDDRFKIASLSKPLTATAILALISQGKLTLDARLVDLMPKARTAVDTRIEAVTLRHLLQHSAGWDHEQSFDPYFIDEKRQTDLIGETSAPLTTCDDVADAMLALPLQFDPGRRYAYANLGYCWLGRILADRGGGSYAEAVRRLVPGTEGFSLDLDDLTVHPVIAAADVPFLANDPKIVAAAGGWIVNVERFFKFASGPVNSDIVERPAFATGETFYGLGWRIWDLPQGLMLSHFGTLPGVFSIVVRKLDGPLMVAFFKGRPRD